MRAIPLAITMLGCGRIGFTLEDVYVPPDVVAGPGCGARSIAMGEEHTCVLVENGTTYCMGTNSAAELGGGAIGANAETPLLASRLAGAVSVHAGRGFTSLRDAAGEVRCVGLNANQQCGANTTAPALEPLTATGLPPVTQLAAGYSYGCAVTTAGDVFCWGDGDEGEGGNGTAVDRHAPEVVPALAGTNPTLALGASHACALSPAGAVSCWGDGRDLRLGVVAPDTCPNASPGSIACALQPISIPVPLMATLVSGEEHTCGVTQQGGEVWCWGSNTQGQVGVAKSPEESPARIGTLSGVAQIAAGHDHTCVLDAAGGVACWGDNVYLQLGRTGSDSFSPIAIALPAKVTSLHVGTLSYHTCAVLEDGTVWCWGRGDAGQLGRGPSGAGLPSPILLPCP